MEEDSSKSGSEIKDLVIAAIFFLIVVQLLATMLSVLSLDKIVELRLGLEAAVFSVIALFLNRKYPLRLNILESSHPIPYLCIGVAYSVLHFIPYFRLLTRGLIPSVQYLEYVVLPPVRGGVFLLLVIIILPFLEEILFRGFMYRLLARRTSNPAAMIISSLVFTAGHGFHSGWFFDHFILGIICCYIYSKSKTLWTSVITHSANNAVFYLGTFIFFRQKMF